MKWCKELPTALNAIMIISLSPIAAVRKLKSKEKLLMKFWSEWWEKKDRMM